MKILLIHPEDDPERGPWASLPYDRIVDLGMGGKNTYARWVRQFQCPVTTLDSLRNGFDSFWRTRELLGLGCERLFDEHGLDWWEILSILLHGEMETLIVIQAFVKTLGPGDQVYVSRPGLHATFLQHLLPRRVNVFPLQWGTQRGAVAHYLRAFNRLSASQMIDVVCDKYDGGFQLRGRFSRKRRSSTQPVVLLPSAYINVSRTGISYANSFPQENFLLVATRRSGWIENLPRNMISAWLSSYASLRDRSIENTGMEKRWRALLAELRESPEFEILHQLGYLDDVPMWLRRGFAVRDAWSNVLDTEPVQAVICADDSNPNSRIPMLLAHGRGLPNIACHHGALDGRYMFKRTYGEIIWAKGKMEKDYLVGRCGVPQEKVEIGAPAMPAAWNGAEHENRQVFRPCILFISEASDISGGRPVEFYRDVLPLLADLALTTGREVIVKLHPAESEHQRAETLARILSPRQKSIIRIVTGPLTEDLLAKTWFGITILSTVAIECAIRGIPCFLCKWLEFWPYGYVEQFIRFGAGVGLNDSSEIEKIPEYLQQYRPAADIRENCWQPVAAGRMRELLTSARKKSEKRESAAKECTITH